MKEYQGFINRRKAALNLFVATRNKLMTLLTDMRAAKAAAERAIDEQTAKADYLALEMRVTEQSVEQINKVLGDNA